MGMFNVYLNQDNNPYVGSLGQAQQQSMNQEQLMNQLMGYYPSITPPQPQAKLYPGQLIQQISNNERKLPNIEWLDSRVNEMRVRL